MSQPTTDTNATPEGAQGSAKPRSRPRRPLSRAAKAAREQSATPAAAAPSAPEPEPASETPSAVPEAAAPAAQQQNPPAKSGRTRPRRTGSQRASGQPAVQLVKPVTPESVAETPTSGEPLPATITATDQEAPRIVPVITEPATHAAESTAPLALDAGPAPTGAAETPQEQPSEPVSRYRFGRRQPPTVAQTAVRQERLSGALAVPATPAEEEPPSVATAPSASAAEAAPAAELRVAPEPQKPDRDTIADIVSALGLQDLEARANASRAGEAQAVSAPGETDEAEVAAPSTDTAETSEDETSNGEAETTPGRRRRRRRRGSGHSAAGTDEDTEDQAAETGAIPGFDEDVQPERNGYLEYPEGDYYRAEPQPYSPYERSRERAATPDQEWDIGSGTQQLRQRESPFGAPEPSFARGFGPQPRGVAGPAREPYTRTGRLERGADTPPMSPNVLASTVTHAIQQQTDRLLAELRHQSNPPAMTVMFPPFPSTERVGVFVDVANLLYSSRNLRVSIDFGRLLDFLRGNRRLIRAHAYAPTNPDPHAEQSFLSAVKGLGYRITTKNYKTFSSGAKKADMDLDLCMDIVRLVDAGSLDTVVLVSGDSDFLPLLEYCSDHGVRVEVAAFEDAAAMILRQSCDLFVNLSLVDEIRA